MNNLLKVILAAVSLLIFILIIDLSRQNTPTEGFFVIERGENTLQIAGDLKHQGYIGSQLGFVWEALTSGNFRRMKAGRYQIQQGQSDKELIEKFTKAQSVPVDILIAPGKTSKNISLVLGQAHLVKKDEFLDLVLKTNKEDQSEFSALLANDFPILSDRPEGAGLEGYLFPDNYLIDPGSSAQNIAKQMLANFDAKITQDLRDEIKQQKRTIFEVITMASMLEKEVKTYKDKQIVAGILWKRVDNKLPLEVDSTLLYFLTSLHPDLMDKNVDSPYNTYRYAGLPLGPICNPGLESIRASIYPQNSDYWFYLSSADGETIFSKTLGQHLINKAKYLSQ